MVKIKRMRGLALECHLPEEDIEYMEYTFGIIALAREYFFRPFDEDIKKRLHPLQAGSMRGVRTLGLKKQFPSSLPTW